LLPVAFDAIPIHSKLLSFQRRGNIGPLHLAPLTVMERSWFQRRLGVNSRTPQEPPERLNRAFSCFSLAAYDLPHHVKARNPWRTHDTQSQNSHLRANISRIRFRRDRLTPL